MSISAPLKAPIIWVALNAPKPVEPTLRISVAKIGSNAVAPPSSTAKRSSPIAPTKICRFKTNSRPLNIFLRFIGVLLIV